MKIFTSLKNGEGRVQEIQRAALANWRTVFPDVEIVDVGEERRFDKCLEQLTNDELGAWINADILFEEEKTNTILELQLLTSTQSPFLIIGRRTDLLPGGQRELHRPSGMDYFFFTKESFADLPPVIMGRAYCDSALVAHCLRHKIPVIDATKVITALHQWHDYGHVAGGKASVWQGEEAQQNKTLNHLRDFGPHIADATYEVEKVDGDNSAVHLHLKPTPILRRLGLWGLWNRLTHGGLGFWGIHEYVGTHGARFFTRSKVEAWSPNSNVQMKFKEIVTAPPGPYTGFDFPCMFRALREKEHPWTIFLWDPPSLSHRDKFPPLRWVIDFVFRWFARRCDRLVLNIHPGLLDEIGIKVEGGRLEVEHWWGNVRVEYRMQDAFEKMDLPSTLNLNLQPQPQYDFGVLSNWTKAKGGPMMAEVLAHIPDATCLWIGDPPNATSSSLLHGFNFAGRLPQQDAFAQLRNCRVLVVPYLNVPSLKWNYCLKLFEYLPLGRPILASDNPGNAAVAAKFPERITLFKAGDWVDFIAKCAEVDHNRFYPAFRTLQETHYKFHL